VKTTAKERELYLAQFKPKGDVFLVRLLEDFLELERTIDYEGITYEPSPGAHERPFELQLREGCSSTSCVVARPTGLATNGPCGCSVRVLRRAIISRDATIAELRRQLELELHEILEAFGPQAGPGAHEDIGAGGPQQ